MRYHQIIEASMPYGRTNDMTGMTFGFESEIIARSSTFTEEVDWWDLDDENIPDAFDVDHEIFNTEYQEWQKDGHEDGSVRDWIDDIGAAAWWELVRADGGYEYVLSDGEIKRRLPWSQAVDFFVEDIQEGLDIPRIRYSYEEEQPIENKDYSNWHLESDGSVHGELNDLAFELISPVFHSYDEFAMTLRQWLEWFPEHYGTGIYTNRTTGLHINIGMPDAANKIDPLKLLLFSGEKWITKHWRDEGNGYTDELLPKLNAQGLPRSIEDASAIARTFIENLNEKSFAINFLTLINRGYVEFRPIGNAGYETKIDQIFQHIGLFVQMIHIASDPNLYRREYATKLAKLIGGPVDTVSPTMTTPERTVKKWIDSLNYREADRMKVLNAQGKIVISPDTLLMFIASEETRSQGARPIPDTVLRILIRASGMTPDSWHHLRIDYEHNLPWQFRPEGWEAVKRVLDPLLGQ